MDKKVKPLNLIGAIGFLGDFYNYQMGNTTKSQFGLAMTKTAIGVSNPELGLTMLLLDQTKIGKEFDQFLIDRDLLQREKAFDFEVNRRQSFIIKPKL